MIFTALAFIFGLLVGSFLNAVIYRVNTGQKFVFGRSFCPHCRNKLWAKDLVPVLSFLVLGGRCRYCHQKISWQYPLVELSTAFLFSLSYQLRTTNFELVATWFILSVLIIIFVSDLRYGIIPDKIVFPAIFILLFFKIVSPTLQSIYRYVSLTSDKTGIGDILLGTNYWPTQLKVYFSPFLFTLLASILVSLFFLSLIFLTRGRGMGGGDVKLVFLLGLVMGFPKMFIGFFLAFLIGGLVALVLIFLGFKKWGQTLPLGPFLVLGTILELFWGSQILNPYFTVV